MVPSKYQYTTDHIVLNAVRTALVNEPLDSRIAIAYSGGLDSSTLLDAAVRVVGASRCIALHIHHGLSPNADVWANHTLKISASFGVEFDMMRIDVARNSGQGIEASARAQRYHALDSMCTRHQVTVLWLAQHADDQAETVLLQLLRGSGIAGLAAMAEYYLPVSSVRLTESKVKRVRPVLHLSREQLERYAAERCLHWIEDESNKDIRYARNALRKYVLPNISTYFPGFRNTLFRAAKNASVAQNLLDDLAELDFSAAVLDGKYTLSHSALISFNDARAANLLRYWIRKFGLQSPSASRLYNMIRQLRNVHNSYSLCVNHSGYSLRLYRDFIYFEKIKNNHNKVRTESRCIWRGQEIWYLPKWSGTFIFALTSPDDVYAVSDAQLRNAILLARQRRGGERMYTKKNGQARTLKNLFQERGVPVWQRDVPLLYIGDQLLYVPKLGINFNALCGRESIESETSTRWRRIIWK
ncbi:MAG: tRNA lysidine(34) synthetase TilS [Burkholderia sp.]|nr:tRNA lysidine(34) synthetase TilS [Burkholderia sp.]